MPRRVELEPELVPTLASEVRVPTVLLEELYVPVVPRRADWLEVPVFVRRVPTVVPILLSPLVE